MDIKKYIINVGGEYFFTSLKNGNLHSDLNINNACFFHSENDANTFINNKLKPVFKNIYTVVEIKTRPDAAQNYGY